MNEFLELSQFSSYLLLILIILVCVRGLVALYDDIYSYYQRVKFSDKKDLLSKRVSNKIFLSKEDSLGCGSNDRCGFKLIDVQTVDKIKKFIDNSNDITIIATLGGGVGSGSTKAIIEQFHNLDISTEAVIVKPFNWEGRKKSNRSDGTLAYIEPFCTRLLIYSNSDLGKSSHLNIKHCFEDLNDTIHQTLQGQ